MTVHLSLDLLTQTERGRTDQRRSSAHLTGAPTDSETSVCLPGILDIQGDKHGDNTIMLFSELRALIAFKLQIHILIEISWM